MEAVRETTEMHASSAGGATRVQGRVEGQGGSGGDKEEGAMDAHAVDLAGMPQDPLTLTVPRTHERQSDDPRGIPDTSPAGRHG